MVVWLFVFQLVKSLICCDSAILKVFYCIDYLIVCHAAFHNVVIRLISSLTASYYKFEPLQIINREILVDIG